MRHRLRSLAAVVFLTLLLRESPAHASCFKAMAPQLGAFQAQAVEALNRQAEAARRAAHVIDSGMQTHGVSLERIQELRRLNCAQMAEPFRRLRGQAQDVASALSEARRVSVNLQLTYLYYRMSACRSLQISRQHASRLQPAQDSATLRTHLSELARFASVFASPSPRSAAAPRPAPHARRADESEWIRELRNTAFIQGLRQVLRTWDEGLDSVFNGLSVRQQAQNTLRAYTQAEAQAAETLSQAVQLEAQFDELCPCLNRTGQECQPIPPATVATLQNISASIEEMEQTLDPGPPAGAQPSSDTDAPEPAPATRNRPTSRRSTGSARTASDEQQAELRRRLEAIQRERERRLEAERREAQRQTREAARPAQLRSRAETLRITREALERGEANGRVIPADFDWAMVRLEDDARRRRPPLTRAQRQAMQERWEGSLERYRELARGESDPRIRLSRVMNAVAQDYLARYRRGRSGVLNLFDEEGEGNCQARTQMILSVLSRMPELIPEGYQVGVQVFGRPPHVQAVLVPSDPNDHRVIDLLTNSETSQRVGPIYWPTTALNGFLRTHRARGSRNPEHFLMYEADPQPNVPALAAATPPSQDRAHDQEWAPSTAIYGDGVDRSPERGYTPPPPVGLPTRTTDAIPQISGVRAIPSEPTGVVRPTTEQEEAAVARRREDQRRAQFAPQIANERVRQFYLHKEHGFYTAYQQLAAFIEANPNLTPEELMQRVYEEYPSLGRSLAAVESGDTRRIDQALFAYNPSSSSHVGFELARFCDFASLLADCQSLPEVRRLTEAARRRLQYYAEHPGLFIEASERGSRLSEVRRRIDRMEVRGVLSMPGEPQSLPQLREEQNRLENQVHIDSYTLTNWREPLGRGEEIHDQHPLMPLLRVLLDPTQVGLDSSVESVLEEVQALATERSETQLDGSGPSTRTASSPRTPSPSALEEEFAAPYVASHRTLDNAAYLYRGFRPNSEGATPLLIRAFRIMMASSTYPIETPDPGDIAVCGNRFITRYSATELLLGVNRHSLQAIYCPPGSRPTLTPQEEYQRLRSLVPPETRHSPGP